MIDGAHSVELDNDISQTGAVIDLINAVRATARSNSRSNLISECLRDDANPTLIETTIAGNHTLRNGGKRVLGSLRDK